jgi:hypothetical protein
MVRRIKKAFVDHLSFVESPSYVGAKVLAVRGDRMGVDGSIEYGRHGGQILRVY